MDSDMEYLTHYSHYVNELLQIKSIHTAGERENFASEKF